MDQPNITYRTVNARDIAAIARLRTANPEQQAFWQDRIAQYLAGKHHPQKALAERTIIVAEADNEVVGFIAGQLTMRYNCEGELQWLDVDQQFRRKGIASELVRGLAQWFIERKAYRICVDPGNDEARIFYAANGATDLNEHWMYWEDIREY